MTDKMPSGTHPNSLKNLKSAWNSETAKEAQLLGAAKRKANRIARENLKLSINDWKAYKSEVLEKEDMSAIDILKILMHKALMNDEFDTAADLAKNLAEFEKPKLQRVEQKIEEVKADALSDEELDAKLRQFKLVE